MDLFRDKAWRERAIREGMITGFEFQEGGKGRSLGARIGSWSMQKGKDRNFSMWLGFVSPALPFTNAALLFLWFFKIVSLVT